MSFWCEIVCHDCSETVAGRHVRGGSFPLRKMEAVAQRRGWTKRKIEGHTEHLCGGCTHARDTDHQVHRGHCLECEWGKR